jgi:hypothetical protein
MIRTVAVGAGDTIESVAKHFGVGAASVAAVSGTGAAHHQAPMGLQSRVSLQLLAAPIPPFVAMTSPVPAGQNYPYGTGWLGAVSPVQGQYAGQPLSTNM